MVRILITGKYSYVGTSLEKWLGNFFGRYSIDTISLRDGSWKKKDFSMYNVVFHVAGIAHIKETKKNEKLYYEVNRDLAYDVATKAKSDGVKQFVFLSSMSVYGMESGVINKKSTPNPQTNYGKSKLQAEELINSLDGEGFKIATIRPPMIYGRKCKGNYSKLSKLIMKVPIFPDIKNKRSMIYIDNLCEFIKLIIDNHSSGLFFPQNTEYVCTSELARNIAAVHKKKIWFTKIFNPFIKLIKTGTVQKIFGDLVYEKGMSQNKESYAIISFHDSVNASESRENDEV
ncbi:NAD-dependent epimerase/dehydratase family protein [Lentibacillus sp. N15]|uniref:NAD-dependent epimerase/dehydratase family protein n=1 Tax=Lentibacillus songyuanensis TaxID=3136161 RepID=UPI0031B9BE41